MSSYEFINLQNYNEEKKNIILFLLERNIGKDPVYMTYKYLLNTVEILQKDFNIFVISKVSAKQDTWVNTMKNTNVLKDCIYIDLDSKNIFHPDATGEKELYDDDLAAYDYTYNYMTEKLFEPLYKENPWLFDNLQGTLCSSFFLPYERNHEIIPYTEQEATKLEKMKTVIYNRLTNIRQIFSFRILSQRNLYPLHFLIYLMKKKPEIWHYSFCHDTISIWYPFVPELNPHTKNVKCFYFVNDSRGLRNLIKFPIAELQELGSSKYLYKKDFDEIIKNKKHDFIFGGTFPYDVGYRLNDWKRFFEDLDADVLVRTQTDGKAHVDPNSEIKDPLETTKFKNKKIKDEAALDVIRSIYNSSIVKPTIPQEQYHEEQKDYLFTIILKCFYGKYDSLNFRVFSSIANGVIPLIADDYDIDNLQIPKYLSDRLTVGSNKDIEDKITWAKENPEEYKELLLELYHYFVSEDDFNEDAYYQYFRNTYFEELYK